MDSETLNVARDRVTRVFRYLEALNQHRNPAKRQIHEQPWVLWLHELPDHPSIEKASIRGLAPPEEPEAIVNSTDRTTDFVLRVRRPKLTHCPTPPELINEWLEHGWEDPFREARIHESRNDRDASGEPYQARFEDVPERLQTFNDWRTRREVWAQNECPARRSMSVFERLYELHGRIQREAERVELILGDGILTWRRPDGGVSHPVLLQGLQLEFNPIGPEFIIFETERPVELYSALFRSMADVDGKAIGRCRDELEQGHYHPLEDQATSGYLRRLVVELSPRGEFTDHRRPQEETKEPNICRYPVLFLRSRVHGFATAIAAVLQDVQQRQDLPGSLVNVVGIEPPLQERDETILPNEIGSETEDEEILLSKAANPEQLRIAQRLEQQGCVLVQGPPGTGKTHTIANLIGHLLGQGKTVLVTSHTTKALRVLREQVVERLKPLCVSVLERDLDSRRQLESSVEAIVDRLSTSDERLLQFEASALASRRNDLLEKLRDLQGQLLNARRDEYRDLVVAGESYPPSEAARWVAVEKGTNSWIPSPVEIGAALPLPEAEILELYRTNAKLSPEDEAELGHALPNPARFSTPEDFCRIIKEKQLLAETDFDRRSDVWELPASHDGADEIEALAARISTAMASIENVDSWRLPIISAGQSGRSSCAPWESLLELIKTVYDFASGAQENLFTFAPVLCEQMSFEEQMRIAAEILDHLDHGRKLTQVMFLAHRPWKRFVQEARVSAVRPSRPEHFSALLILANLEMLRAQLRDRWDRQLGSLGAPVSEKFGTDPEKACWQFIPAISDSLEWHDKVWQPLENSLRNLGFRWDVFLGEQPPNVGPNGVLLRLRDAVTTALPDILSARRDAMRLKSIEVELENLNRDLSLAADGNEGVVVRLRQAAITCDGGLYRETFRRLAALWDLGSQKQRRNDLLARLEKTAQGWAAAIRERCGRHGEGDVPGNVRTAWVWRQLHDELERRSVASLEALQQSIVKILKELGDTTTDLIDRLAWAAQIRRTSLQQRQALIGWLDTVRKIGKGFGKRVPRLRAEAAQKMNECRSAVPVWIMPLSRVVENFDPRTTRFDVVIIDEASQSDVMGLIAFYLGRKIVVVGDHEQVSPAAVGQDLGVVQHLIDEYLRGIPNAELYDGQMSVYDLARQSFGATICLLEHFRCVSEIIQFSNHLSYDGRIKPLRDASDVRLKPHIVPYRVRSSLSNIPKVSKEEAWVVASLLAAAIEQPEYEDKKFGVISLVGDEQAREIEQILLRHISPEEHQTRRILCGNAAHFQGDERDVMFLSLVDVAVNGPLSLRTQQMFKQRFNVAASRAKDQMWVVHSLDPRKDLKPGDLRRRLIEHAEDPLALVRAMERGERKVESELEKRVLRKLIEAGYRVVPQWPVGYYRIDLVVEGSGKRLAVECDGDRYHPIEKLQDDMARQTVLERLGWTFSRIRGSEFFRDPDKALAPVFERLHELEIFPEGVEPANGSSYSDTELKERVIRRADELRRLWRNVGFSAGGSEFEEEVMDEMP